MLFKRRPLDIDRAQAERELKKAEQESKAALETASAAHKQWPEVHELAEKLKQHHEDNHLAEVLVELFKGNRR